MRTKINYIRHFGVLLATIMIFVVGIFIGGSVQQLRVQNLYDSLQDQDLSYQNLVTEGKYIDYIVSLKKSGKNVSCSSIEGTYFSSIKNLDNSRIKLENYINSGKVNDNQFSKLKEHYADVQINYWILANEISNLCDNNLNTILYFYADDKKCPQCQDQGVHLNYVKQKLKKNVLIFSLDVEKAGPTQLLAKKYESTPTSTPNLVINNKVYGFLTNEEIFKILNVSKNLQNFIKNTS